MPESKTKFLIPTIAAAAVVTGGVVAYMYLKSPAGDISALGSAKVIPSTALMAAYINTDAAAWAKLDQFGTPEARKLFQQELEKFQQETLKESNISYEKDIKPWVGNVMLAVLPPNAVKPAQLNTPGNGSNQPIEIQPEPNVLVVIGIKDKLSALNFSNKLKAQKQVKFVESDYKGEKITETRDQGKPTYSTILNNSQLVLAPEKRTVEQAIDTYKGQPSFASKEGASIILAKGVNIENSLAQIYVPDYAGMVQQLIASNPQATQLPPQTLNQLKLVKSMVMGVGIDDAGVRLKALANLDPQLSKFQYQTAPAKIIGQFPADTLALVSGQSISRSWSMLVEQSKDTPEFNQAVQLVRQQLKSVADLDLDQEVLGWMDGEFAAAAIPSNQGILAQVGVGGAFVFNTSDRKTAESTLSKLDNLVKQQSLNVAKKNLGGKEITEWLIPQQGALLAHGWLDQNTVFVALGGPIAETLITAKNPSLDTSESFKAVTGSLQKPNGGYFYLDMDKTMTLVRRFAPPSTITPEANAVISSIRGLGITATSPNNSSSELEMLLALKPSTTR